MSQYKSMAEWVEEYIAHRRSLGFRMGIEHGELLRFAQYATDTGHRGPLTTDLALCWVRLPQRASHSYQLRRLATIRSFAKYLAVYETRTEVPPRFRFSSGSRRPAPYIYSQQEITDLLRACAELAPSDGLRPQTYRTLFGLIAATGLRISEALKLNRNDVDIAQELLTILKSKFRKSRLVPVHETTRQALRHYADQRDRYLPSPALQTFFLSDMGNALPYPTVSRVFSQLRLCLGWEHKNRGRSPRIHDLRHTFACRRILAWYNEGIDVNQFIPLLSTYLGHAKVTDTYWYLTGTTELLGLTAKKFEQYAQPEKGGGS